MDYILRCNNHHNCRADLQYRAIVTSCSHVFCEKCADTSGLSRANLATRSCPACRAPLYTQDDVVLADLNPTEEYKSTVLSGLSPAIISECASRALAFWSYQATKEIAYGASLVKSLTEKHEVLEQGMEQMAAEANSQLDYLQHKMRGMQEERDDLEKKNCELGEAFRDKSLGHQKLQRAYQQLKAQVLVNNVTDAAGEEAELAVNTARGDRFVSRIPGARAGGTNLNQLGSQNVGSERRRNRNSSGSNEYRAGIGLAPQFGGHLQARGGVGSRINSGQSASVRTPGQSQAHQSRIPALGGQRRDAFHHNAPGASEYRASPMMHQSMGGNLGSRNGSNNLTFESKLKRTRGLNNNIGHFQ